MVAKTCDRGSLCYSLVVAWQQREEGVGIPASPSRVSSVTKLPLLRPHFYSEPFGTNNQLSDHLDTNNCDVLHSDSILTLLPRVSTDSTNLGLGPLRPTPSFRDNFKSLIFSPLEYKLRGEGFSWSLRVWKLVRNSLWDAEGTLHCFLA